jgi:hypothetical protein
MKIKVESNEIFREKFQEVAEGIDDLEIVFLDDEDVDVKVDVRYYADPDKRRWGVESFAGEGEPLVLAEKINNAVADHLGSKNSRVAEIKHDEGYIYIFAGNILNPDDYNLIFDNGGHKCVAKAVIYAIRDHYGLPKVEL